MDHGDTHYAFDEDTKHLVYNTVTGCPTKEGRVAPAPYPCSGVERCPLGAVRDVVAAWGWGRYRYIPSMMSIH